MKLQDAAVDQMGDHLEVAHEDALSVLPLSVGHVTGHREQGLIAKGSMDGERLPCPPMPNSFASPNKRQA